MQPSVPILSIVVPIYQSEKHLQRCLDSILAQTYKDFELICVDDGSPDNSNAILDAYQLRDYRIIIIHQKNEGMAGARNSGLRIARGKYISFVDSDDYIEEGMYQTMLERAASSQSDLVVCGVYIDVETNVEVLADPGRVKENEQYFLLPSNEDIVMNQDIYLMINATVWNKLYRRELIEQNNLSFPKSLWYEDSYFVHAYCTLIQTVSFVQEKFYHYCFHDGSIMGQTIARKTKKLSDNINVAYELYRFLVAHSKMDEYARSFFRYYTNQFKYAVRYAPDKKVINTIVRTAEKHLQTLPVHQYASVMDDDVLALLQSIQNKKYIEKPVKKLWFKSIFCVERDSWLKTIRLFGVKFRMIRKKRLMIAWNDMNGRMTDLQNDLQEMRQEYARYQLEHIHQYEQWQQRQQESMYQMGGQMKNTELHLDHLKEE